MTRIEVFEIVKKALFDRDYIPTDPAFVLEESHRMNEDLGVDSAGELDVICALERQFHLGRPENQLDFRQQLRQPTVAGLVNYVSSRLAKKHSVATA